MRAQVTLSIHRAQVGEAIFSRIAEWLGDPGRRHYLAIWIEHAHPALPEIRALLHGRGLKPWLQYGREPLPESEFTICVHRIYTPAELLTFPGIWTGETEHLAEEPKPDGEGRPSVPRIWLVRKGHRDWDLLSACPSRYFARQNVKSALGALGLDVTFTPAVVGDETGWWELDTQQVMPRLGPGLTLLNWKANAGPPDEDFATGFAAVDWVFADTQLRYEPEALAFLDRVGIARTYEPFGGHTGRRHDACPLMMSRRVYKALLDAGALMNVIPIRSSADPEPPEERAIKEFWESMK